MGIQKRLTKSKKEDLSLSDLWDKRRSKRQSSAVNLGNSADIEELTREDLRATTDDIAEHLGISHESAAKTAGELGFEKVCAR